MSTLLDIEQGLHAQRGLQDGRGGLLPKSQAPAYTDGYERGRRYLQAASGEIVLAFADASRCEGCKTTFFGPIFECACATPSKPMEQGLLVMFWQADDADPVEFMSARRARELCAQGVDVVTETGDSLAGRLMIQ